MILQPAEPEDASNVPCFPQLRAATANQLEVAYTMEPICFAKSVSIQTPRRPGRGLYFILY